MTVAMSVSLLRRDYAYCVPPPSLPPPSPDVLLYRLGAAPTRGRQALPGLPARHPRDSWRRGGIGAGRGHGDG